MKPLLEYITTKNMRDDLIFYLEHANELYFKGMVTVAVAFIVIAAIGVYVTACTFVNGVSPENILLLLALSAIVPPVIGFAMVKMYLHIRKDAIEIKEMLKK